MNPPSSNVVAAETVTVNLDDHEEVVFVVDNDVPLPPASLTPPPPIDDQEDDVYIVLPTPVSSLSLFPSPVTTAAATNPSGRPLVSSTSSDLLSVTL